MTFYFYDLAQNEKKEFNSKEEAEIALQTMHELFLTQEDYRFTMAKVVVNGNDTIWMDVEGSPEEGEYHVFNQATGLHEPYPSLSSAKIRMQELKQEFLKALRSEVFDSTVIQQPTTQGTQDL
jgi:hypothetical protein